MKIKYLLLLVIPTFVFASGGEGGNTDIIERSINFIIFFAILYYLLADIIKGFVQGRSADIAKRFQNIQNELKKSQKEKAEAIKSVEDAKVLSAEIIENAKKEAEILVAKISEESNQEINNLLKSHNERLEIEERKMVREVVSEIIEDIFEDKSISLDKNDFINLVLKRAA